MEVVVWTLLFLGGDLIILVVLLTWAVRKDREKARLGTKSEG